MLIHDIAQTIDRQQTIDMTLPWIYRGFGILIAVEDDTANVKAVIKPFQWPVYNNTKKLFTKGKRAHKKNIYFTGMVGAGHFNYLRRFRVNTYATVSCTSLVARQNLK